MQFPTPQDIEAMRSRGFDPSTIAPLEKRCIRAERVRSAIRAAFSDVVLGNGVGLLQGQALDDYADDADQAKARALDEKNDWSSIPVKRLNECHSSLSFFDAEGVRFHLPAFMLAQLAGEFDFDLCFHLAYSTDPVARFAFLNEDQRIAVRIFLELIRDEPDMQFHIEHIDRALDGFWSKKTGV